MSSECYLIGFFSFSCTIRSTQCIRAEVLKFIYSNRIAIKSIFELSVKQRIIIFAYAQHLASTIKYQECIACFVHVSNGSK